jgi:hypothetical protein
MTFLELFGYASSVMVAISLMMSNILRLRILNAVGALTFAIYGYCVGAYPVVAVNGWIFLVDIYFLYKMLREKDFFKLLEGIDHKSPYLANFIDFYKDDILKFAPNFDSDRLEKPEIVFILRNLVPAGVFIFCKNEKERTIDIILDYTIPAYRDMKNTSFLLFDKKVHFRELGFEKYITRTNVKEHSYYLKKMKFKLIDKSQGLYEKDI